MANEALELRRPYYSKVFLHDGPGFCIDDRISEKPAYIKFPGGLLFLASNLAIMRCLSDQPRLSQMEAIELVERDSAKKVIVLEFIATTLAQISMKLKETLAEAI